MLNHFLISTAIVAHILGITVPQALEEDVYIVPTIEDELHEEQNFLVHQFEWRLQNAIRAQARPPALKNYGSAPDLAAKSALVMDVSSKQLLWQKNPDDVVPIASITKLMTALVWLDNQPTNGLQHIHTFAPEQDTPIGKELDLPHGAKVTASDLLHTSLIASDNDTAMALAHTTSLSDTSYVDLMNHKARALSMNSTTFMDQTGLHTGNVSTPHDIARLALEAFSKPEIADAVELPDYTIETADEEISRRVYTTNQLLFDTDFDIIAGKTGYLEEAGYCVVVKAEVPNSDREVIAVILGTDSDEARFTEAKKLLQWTYDNYVWY